MGPTRRVQRGIVVAFYACFNPFGLYFASGDDVEGSIDEHYNDAVSERHNNREWVEDDPHHSGCVGVCCLRPAALVG